MSPSATDRSRSHRDAAKRMSPLVSEVMQEYGAATKEALARYLPEGYPTQYLYD